jgi:hypothetical protein
MRVAPLLSLALAGLVALAPASVRAAGMAADVRAACLDQLPDEARDAAPADASGADGTWGRWWITTGEMDGQGGPEAVLVWLPAGKKGEIHFVSGKEGDSPEVKKVKLKGKPVVDAAIAFPSFEEGKSLLHVNAGEGGQVLLFWDGKDLDDVWEVGKTRPDETRWFELEDLDADGRREVISYVRRDLGGAMDDELDLGDAGADRRTTDQVDPVAVFRLDGDQWKKDAELLEGLR